MPRYHLLTRCGDVLLPDDEGEEYSSLDEARTEALESARELMAERLRSGRPLNVANSSMEIYGEDGALRCIVPFASAYRG